jgi:hypothetical protein
MSDNTTPLSDEQFEALKQQLATEEARRAVEKQARYETWVKPLQVSMHGDEIKSILNTINTARADPVAVENPNQRLALEALFQAINNAQLNIPAIVAAEPEHAPEQAAPAAEPAPTEAPHQ